MKKVSFLHFIAFAPLSKVSWLYFYEFISGPSIPLIYLCILLLSIFNFIAFLSKIMVYMIILIIYVETWIWAISINGSYITFQSIFSNCWVQSLINHSCFSSFFNSYFPLDDLSMTDILKVSTIIMKLFLWLFPYLKCIIWKCVV